MVIQQSLFKPFDCRECRSIFRPALDRGEVDNDESFDTSALRERPDVLTDLFDCTKMRVGLGAVAAIDVATELDAACCSPRLYSGKRLIQIG